MDMGVSETYYICAGITFEGSHDFPSPLGTSLLFLFQAGLTLLSSLSQGRNMTGWKPAVAFTLSGVVFQEFRGFLEFVKQRRYKGWTHERRGTTFQVKNKCPG